MAHQDDMNWLRKEKLIVRLQGKEFILYAGLIALARKHGLNSIQVDRLESGPDGHVFKAIVDGELGRYEAHGDASPKNVGKMIVPHAMRMAETRAIARALRSYTAVGMCSLEELGGSTEDARPVPPTRKPRANKTAPKVEEPPTPSTEALLNTEPAGKNGKHPSWAGEHKVFCKRVEEMGWSYEQVAKMAENDGHPRPSQMARDERVRLLAYLEDQLLQKWEGA